jgi:hypothetical protein
MPSFRVPWLTRDIGSMHFLTLEANGASWLSPLALQVRIGGRSGKSRGLGRGCRPAASAVWHTEGAEQCTLPCPFTPSAEGWVQPGRLLAAWLDGDRSSPGFRDFGKV